MKSSGSDGAFDLGISMVQHWFTMKTRFARVGNSQGLMIPIEVMRERGWEVGDEVEIEPTAGGLMVFSGKGRKDIAKIAQRLVRENIDLVRRLAKL